MIKGKNQHVMPSNGGWNVIDEANHMVTQYFETREEAMAYARHCAAIYESDVLVHETACDPGCLSSVTLPQREFLPSRGVGHPVLSEGALDSEAPV